MNPYTDYKTALLSAQTLSALKHIEQDLSAQEGQPIVLVAYTQDEFKKDSIQSLHAVEQQ
ncbi:MAG: hypothetical protein OWR52_12000 [Acidibacillus sp.]|uniref:Uncharacterized protein n=1 Tax=Sulfoacidibacillus ferrooxidans TaxID=2005001 RepID=A0A9X1V759_9BACL|nr:hypothetical protein [Sulfoacidibacillus ferrooxidans]MCI0182519.1 hypothetical protein [Sulfoacidibacillus ferrooxidans]MCY0894207.1 hypothetical protein [Acidibacillus sp.]